MARNFSYPGVYRKETDLSEVAASAGTSTGVIVGRARKGMLNARTLISNDKELVTAFGTPYTPGVPITNTNDFGIYAGLQFLQESNSLYYTRIAGANAAYSNTVVSAGMVSSAVTNTSITLQPISAHTDANTPDNIYDINQVSVSNSIVIASIGPGTDGNNIAVRLTTWTDYSSAGTSANVDWRESYDDPDEISNANALWKKVFKVDVYTRANSATPAPTSVSTPAETFYGTVGDYVSPNGEQLNIQQIVNGVSKYIYINSSQMAVGTVPSGLGSSVILLTGGVDDTSEPSAANVSLGWSQFYTDREKSNINILIGSYMSNTVDSAIGAVVNTRRDCIGTVQVGAQTDLTPSTLITLSQSPTFAAPSYVAKYAGWDKVYDSYNDKQVLIPKSIFGAVLMARTDRIANTWNAPAGVNRGLIPVLDQNIRWSEVQIGQLYDANINTSKFVKGVGNVMWGQRTAQKKVSALKEIAVRRLLLYIENSIEPTLVNFLFEPNNESTRLRVVSVVDSFLDTVVAGGGLVQKEVVCDDRNNKSQDIDNNILNVDLYVKPSRAIEFIQLQLIITKSGVSFAEVI
jgi:hypothetical protein